MRQRFLDVKEFNGHFGGAFNIILPIKPGVFLAMSIMDKGQLLSACPNQQSALRLIDLSRGTPLVGPVPKIYQGKPSPTSVDHVMPRL